jgi:hypothetical protein
MLVAQRYRLDQQANERSVKAPPFDSDPKRPGDGDADASPAPMNESLLVPTQFTSTALAAAAKALD